MKTQTVVTDVTQEDLVNLFSTSTEGSSWLSIGSPSGSIDGITITDDDCREDVWAKIILAGKKLYFYDYYAEEDCDHYGKLTHVWMKNGDGDYFMRYEFTLKDIEVGIAKAFDNGGFENQCANHLVYEPEQLDLYDAEALMQIIVFGELIYG